MSVSLSTPPSTNLDARVTNILAKHLVLTNKTLNEFDKASGRIAGFFWTTIRSKTPVSVADLEHIARFLEIEASELYEQAEALPAGNEEIVIKDALLKMMPCRYGWCTKCEWVQEWSEGFLWQRIHGRDYEPVQLRLGESYDLRDGSYHCAEDPAFELMDSELQGTAQAFEAATAFFRLAEDVLAAQRAARGEANLVGAL